MFRPFQPTIISNEKKKYSEIEIQNDVKAVNKPILIASVTLDSITPVMEFVEQMKNEIKNCISQVFISKVFLFSSKIKLQNGSCTWEINKWLRKWNELLPFKVKHLLCRSTRHCFSISISINRPYCKQIICICERVEIVKFNLNGLHSCEWRKRGN